MHYSDQEIAKNIGEGSMGELAGTFHYYKNKAPNLYAILACHPSISEGQRELAIECRSNEIKANIMNVNRDALNVTIGHNGHSRILTTQQFVSLKESVLSKILENEEKKSPLLMEILGGLQVKQTANVEEQAINNNQ